MDIDLLSKMVKELILDEDRVVLPGLGAFVAEIVPATFSDKGYTINPPYRKLYFRSKPDEGDELVTFYATSNKIEKEMAQRIIGDFLSELRDVLHEKKTVVFPGLGRLRATKENNLFFVADEDLDIYPEGFGLEPVSLKTHTETRAQVAAAVVGLKSIIEDTSGTVLPEPEVGNEAVVESSPIVEQKDVQLIEIESEPVSQPVSEPVLEPVSQPVSEPASESVSQPESEPDSEPEVLSEPSAVEPEVVAESGVAPEPEVLPEPQTDESEFVSEQSSLPEPVVETSEPASDEPEPLPEPVVETELVQKAEPVPEEKPATAPVQDLRPQPAAVPAQEWRPQPAEEPKKKSAGRRFLKAMLWIAGIAAVLLIAFTLTARLNPELFDTILYTPEELEIVRSL
ncbi:MAG: hypothetical protein IJ402_01175 [Bacteroidales bacterium]|nr:hypothetical protein [Bacteroidales bacterium]